MIGDVSVARVHSQYGDVPTTVRREVGRTTEDLGPVGGEPLHMVGVLTGVRERMIQLRILQATGVVRLRQGQDGRIPSGEVVQRRSHENNVAAG